MNKKRYKKEWYQANKERILASRKKYYANNTEQILEYKKEHYKDNKEHYFLKNKSYYANNTEQILEQKKEYYKDNKEHIKAYLKIWRLENPEYGKLHHEQWRKDNKDKCRAISRRRRALKNGAVGFHIENDLQYIYEQQKGKCISCNKKIPYEKMTVDHIKPLSKGGSDLPYNIQLLCKSCNSSKGNHHTTDYRDFKIDLLRNKSSIRMIFD